jgi:hypothetical protein
MNGRILFPDLKSLAEFFKSFGGETKTETGEILNPSTATFTVQKEFDGWVLKFNGGY